MAIFTARAASDGAVLGLGGLFPVTSTVPATTMASEASQPKMNAAPLRTPPLDAEYQEEGGQRDRLEGDDQADEHQIEDHMRHRWPSRPSDRRDRLAVGPTPCCIGRCVPDPARRQSLLWRNLRTNTTTKTMAIAAKTIPPM